MYCEWCPRRLCGRARAFSMGEVQEKPHGCVYSFAITDEGDQEIVLSEPWTFLGLSSLSLLLCMTLRPLHGDMSLVDIGGLRLSRYVGSLRYLYTWPYAV